MNQLFVSLTVCAMFLIAIPVASAVTIDWSPVGIPGNKPDPSTGFGAVPYVYNIGTYDVTNSQYVEFLNTVDPTGQNKLGLYNPVMSLSFGGVKYTPGSAGGSNYSVQFSAGAAPVMYVSWYDAIRFANWMNNGQGNGDTETGAYTLEGGTPTPSNANSIVRNPDAKIFLPSEDEWYKAAYFLQSKAVSIYVTYGTRSNSQPFSTFPPYNAANPLSSANSVNWDNAVGAPTAVGAYTSTKSPVGAYDMTGDVWQWNEALINGTFRGARQGAYNTLQVGFLQKTDRFFHDPANSGAGIEVPIGFRLASIPEPSTGVLAVLGLGFIWALRRRLRRR